MEQKERVSGKQTNRQRSITFTVNSVLIVLGIATSISGLIIQWHYHLRTFSDGATIFALCRQEWNAIHVWTSIVFFIAIIYHVWSHRRWYNNLLKKNVSAKQRPTAILTVLTFTVVITGLIPLFIHCLKGCSIFRFSMIEIHDKVAILFFIVAFRHTIKRWKGYFKLK